MSAPFHVHDDGTFWQCLQGGREVARYHYRDPFKPHFHPLCTPLGRTVTLASPHDHKHHKGLMYALRTERDNFWEEKPAGEGEHIGRQVHLAFESSTSEGASVGFVEKLAWLSGADGEPVVQETRAIRVQQTTGGSFLWTWQTHLRFLRKATLIQSRWSRPRAGGAKTNYHGLGIRLPRPWSGPRNNGFFADGQSVSFTEAFGTFPREARFFGAFDGDETPSFATVTMRQHQAYCLYLLELPFAFMAFGPSTAAQRVVEKDEEIDETYEIEVSDGKPT
jgi:hypothetical protein